MGGFWGESHDEFAGQLRRIPLERSGYPGRCGVDHILKRFPAQKFGDPLVVRPQVLDEQRHRTRLEAVRIMATATEFDDGPSGPSGRQQHPDMADLLDCLGLEKPLSGRRAFCRDQALVLVMAQRAGTHARASSRAGHAPALDALIKVTDPARPSSGPLALDPVRHERHLPHIKHVGEVAKTQYLREANMRGFDDAPSKTGPVG